MRVLKSVNSLISLPTCQAELRRSIDVNPDCNPLSMDFERKTKIPFMDLLAGFYVMFGR
jgi:hypothetical protein